VGRDDPQGRLAARHELACAWSIANAEVLLASSDARSDLFADAYARCYRRGADAAYSP
jgi:ADP-ribosyl-[dinitrogen reductase] hydrolase